MVKYFLFLLIAFNAFACKAQDTIIKNITVWDTVYRIKNITVWDTVYRIKNITVWDTVYRTKTITVWDTAYRVKTLWDTVYQTRIVMVDSQYTVPRPIDSPYTVSRIIYKDSCVGLNIDTAAAANIKFGVLLAQTSISETEAIMNANSIKIVRVPVFFSNTVSSSIIDQYLRDGFQVAINFNYQTTATPVPFPTDTVFIRARAKAFFNYYKPYINKIPFVAVENEWDNLLYHSNDVSYYLTELAIVVDEGHKAGFKVTDGGITGNNLQRWTYSKLNAADQSWWIQHYFVGTTMSNYQPMLDRVNKFIAGVKTIPVDYINAHWYNATQCYGGYVMASEVYANACNKSKMVNNEFGIKANDLSLFNCTLQEIKDAGTLIAIAYSGTGNDGLAVPLSNEMINELR